MTPVLSPTRRRPGLWVAPNSPIRSTRSSRGGGGRGEVLRERPAEGPGAAADAQPPSRRRFTAAPYACGRTPGLDGRRVEELPRPPTLRVFCRPATAGNGSQLPLVGGHKLTRLPTAGLAVAFATAHSRRSTALSTGSSRFKTRRTEEIRRAPVQVHSGTLLHQGSCSSTSSRSSAAMHGWTA